LQKEKGKKEKGEGRKEKGERRREKGERGYNSFHLLLFFNAPKIRF